MKHFDLLRNESNMRMESTNGTHKWKFIWNQKGTNTMATISKQRTVSDKELTVGAIILVRGNIEFSRLTKHIEGEELLKDQRRKVQMGMNPVDKPYTTVQLTNARIVPLHPGEQTPDEKFVEERFWKREGDPADAPYHYSINNKSPFPNLFYQAKPGKATEGDQIYPEAELANGLDIILVLRVFQPKGFNRKSVTLNSIILQEPVRYYVGANSRALEEAGIILHNKKAPETAAAPVAAQTTPAAAPVQPVAPAVSAPTPGNAFATAAPAAPAANTAAAQPAGPWTCPSCGSLVGADQKFCGSCGQKREEAAPVMGNGNPYAAAAAAAAQNAGGNNNGIRYDPDSAARDY